MKKSRKFVAKKKTELVGRNRMTRFMMDRVERMHAIFAKQWAEREDAGRGYVSAQTLAADFEINEKTVRRDIEFIRDTLGLPVEYVAAKRGYGYTREVAQLPSLRITEGELMALCIAKEAMEGRRSTPLGRTLQSAVDKLTSQFQEAITFDFEQLHSKISFHLGGYEAPVDLELFEGLSRAVLDRSEVTFDYSKLSEDGESKLEERRVEPLHLVCFDNAWYLFANDLMRGGERRRFALTRMRKLERAGRFFSPDERFDLAKELSGCFGIFSMGDPVRVRVRFDRAVRQFVEERRWHATQRITQMEDGGIELEMEVSQTPDLTAWVLRWGGDAEVMEPESLRVAVERHAERIVARRRRR